MNLIQFNECCPLLGPEPPCDSHERITITFDFSQFTAIDGGCPQLQFLVVAYDSGTPGYEDVLPGILSVLSPPYQPRYGNNAEEMAESFYLSNNIPMPFKEVARLEGSKVKIAFTWQWLLENELATTKADAIAKIEIYANIFSPYTSTEHYFVANYLDPSDPDCGSGSYTRTPDFITHDYCEPVAIIRRCEELPYLTAKVIFNVGSEPALPSGDTVRKVNLSVPCFAIDACATADYDSPETVSGNSGLQAAIAALAAIYNAQGETAEGYDIQAVADGAALTLDFVFPDEDTFRFFCLNCIDNIRLCIRDQYNFEGPIETSFTTIPKKDAFCSCAEPPTPIVCKPEARYCLPIQPLDVVAVPIDMSDTEFAAGTYRVGLCQGCDIIDADIGSLTVNANKFGYLQARIPKTMAGGCYTYCIAASSWQALPSENPCCDNKCVQDWEINGTLCAWLAAYKQTLEDYYVFNGAFPTSFEFDGLPENYPAIFSGCYNLGLYSKDFYLGGSVVGSVFFTLAPNGSDCLHSYAVTLYASNESGAITFQGQICRSDNAGVYSPTPDFVILACPDGFTRIIEGEICGYNCVNATHNLFTWGDKGAFENIAHWQLGLLAGTNMALARPTTYAHSGQAALRATVKEFLANPSGLIFSYPAIPLMANRSYIFEYYVYVETFWPEIDRNIYTQFSDYPSGWAIAFLTPNSILPSDGAGHWIRMAAKVDTHGSGGALGAYPALSDGFSSDNPARMYFDDFTIYDVTPPALPTGKFLAKNYCSGCLVVGAGCYTMELRATNNGSGLGIPYAALPASVTQFRVGGYLRNAQNTADREIYLDSKGNHIKVYSQVQRQVDIETDYLTDNLHESIALCLEHDKLEIRQHGERRFTEYSAFEDYKRTDIKQRPEFPLRKAIAKLMVTPFNKTNSFC